MLPERNRDRIGHLNDELYSRTRYKNPEDDREPISESDETAPDTWKSQPIDDLLLSERRVTETYPFIKKVFLVALLFCICAAIAAALIYFKGDNFISTKNLDISVEGPVSIAAGSIVDLQITISNNNNAALDNVSLNLIYPEDTRSADNPTEELQYTKETLENIGAGKKAVKTARAVFLGAEGDVKEVRISVSYHVTGSNAVFTKDKIFELTIGSAPVTLSVSHPESVTSGNSFTTTVNITANSEEVLKNVILRADYPYGWTLAEATPNPSGTGKNVWAIGDLSPGDKKTITLRGVLLGEDDEERTFRFAVGSGEAQSLTFDTPLSTDTVVVSINKPSLALSAKINGDSSDVYIAPAGKSMQLTTNFKNNLPANLLSPQINVKLSGTALDRVSVTPVGGFYDSAQSAVFWNGGNYDNLKVLAPGDEGSVTLNFASLQNLPTNTANQEIILNISLSGRNQDTNQIISVDEKRTVRIASQASLSSRSLYTKGPFTNKGPVPPKAESETTYTIELSLRNTQNDITEAKVTGTLGANVKWLSQISPAANVKYDEDTKVFSWDVGTLPSGTGFSSEARVLYFQVALSPSLGQVGGTPVLLGNIAFSGTDAFTKTLVRLTNPAVTTAFTTDPSYVQSDGIVVK